MREALTTAETECEVVVLDVVLRSPAQLALPCLNFLHLRHRLSATPSEPPGLLAEDSWIGLALHITDVFPVRLVVKASAMTTLTVGALLTCKILMVHNNPPIWPRIFLGQTVDIIYEI